MGWPVYSERFFIAYGTELYTRYTVPEGRRAVIRNVTWGKDSQLGGYFFLFVTSLAVLYREFPAAAAGDALDVRIPVYGGEVFEVYTSYQGLKVAVSGHEFDDPEGRSGPRGEVAQDDRAASVLPG